MGKRGKSFFRSSEKPREIFVSTNTCTSSPLPLVPARPYHLYQLAPNTCTSSPKTLVPARPKHLYLRTIFEGGLWDIKKNFTPATCPLHMEICPKKKFQKNELPYSTPYDDDDDDDGSGYVDGDGTVHCIVVDVLLDLSLEELTDNGSLFRTVITQYTSMLSVPRPVIPTLLLYVCYQTTHGLCSCRMDKRCGSYMSYVLRFGVIRDFLFCMRF